VTPSRCITGKDKGATGKVIAVNRETSRVIGRGCQPGHPAHQGRPVLSGAAAPVGIVVQEAPIHVSNVAVVDPSDKKPTRIKTRVETVERDGRQKASRVRVGVRSGKDL
jgi:large subunit ribosomal protein L24